MSGVIDGMLIPPSSEDEGETEPRSAPRYGASEPRLRIPVDEIILRGKKRRKKRERKSGKEGK